VAEDDNQLRQLVRSLLSEFGYTVIEAVDGEDAVAKIREHGRKIQLLLLDVIMPKKNGMDVYQEATKLIPGVPTLFTSGYSADTLDKKGVFDQGMNFVSKPVSPTELLTKVREIIDQGGQPKQRPGHESVEAPKP
jgi:DNA-binding response OmpR family regulator